MGSDLLAFVSQPDILFFHSLVESFIRRQLAVGIAEVSPVLRGDGMGIRDIQATAGNFIECGGGMIVSDVSTHRCSLFTT